MPCLQPLVIANGVEHGVGRTEEKESAQGVNRRLSAACFECLVFTRRAFHRAAELVEPEMPLDGADHAVTEHKQQQREQDADQDTRHEPDENDGA